MSKPHEDNSNESHDQSGHAAFLRLYTKYQHRILAYIFTLVPNRADAEDLLQETSILLWEKFDQFEEGTDFVAWSCRVAFLKISNHRKRFTRSKLIFSDDLLAAVAERTIELASQLEGRRVALRECMKRLEDRDRRMIMARYESGGDTGRAAQASGRTIQATYKALYRIRKALFDCVTLRMADGDVQ
jgi:RNA polymerase sigma-70 factor (ECF subfamily)